MPLFLYESEPVHSRMPLENRDTLESGIAGMRESGTIESK
jgi:hypothetical protein